ncbi:MAG: XRE family transcriptional regulator, partial [Candidatus Syntrophonatronum acetioxidans]
MRYVKGLSQRKLASKAGISNSTVHRIEKGIIKNVKPQVL